MNGGRDKMRWKLTKSGVFSAKSLYREMTFGGVRDSRMMEFWKAPIPLNIKIFHVAHTERENPGSTTTEKDEMAWKSAVQALWRS